VNEEGWIVGGWEGHGDHGRALDDQAGTGVKEAKAVLAA
jgi:hypothetical protein